MDRKIRIIMLVMALGMMCAEELMILSAQDSTGSATQQTQIPNDTSKEQVSTHTPQDPLTQQTQPSNDTTGENPSTGIRIFGIHFDPTLRLDMSLSIFLMLLVFIFGSKTRSKSPPELTSEEVSKPENASEVEEYIKAVDRNPKATLVEKAIADAYMLQRGERIEEAIEKWRSIANITEGNDNRLASRGLVSVGYLCVKEGMGEDALLALNKAINLEPDFVEAYNNRGAAKNLLGKHQDAIADMSALNDRGLPALTDINMSVHSHEIVGIVGVSGNGQKELAEVINGLRRPTQGRVTVKQQDVTEASPGDRYRLGLAYVPEDRLGVGLAPKMSVVDNSIVRSYRHQRRGLMLVMAKCVEFCQGLVERFGVRTGRLNDPIAGLSGGNLQRLLLGRELAEQPAVLVAAQPTRGLDVQGVAAIQSHLVAQRAEGVGVLLISEDLDELLALSDRLLVMYEGRVVSELAPDVTPRSVIGEAMAGQVRA